MSEVVEVAETTAELVPIVESNGTNGHPVPAGLANRSPLDVWVAAMERGVDVAKLETLLDLQKKWADEQARKVAAVSLNRCQARMPEVLKDSRNPHTNSRFAQLEAIHRAIKPVYTEEGFSITWSEADSPKEGHMRIVADMIHVGGHVRTYHLDVPLDGVGAKGGISAMNATQAKGSTISYGRRYLEVMIFDVTIAGEDIDGNNPVLDPITADQIQEIVRLFKKVKTVTTPPIDFDRFLKWLEVKDLAELTQEGYRTAIADLNSKFASAGAEAAVKAPGPDGEKP